MIDFGADEHEYDEVQDLPEESTANNQSLLSAQNNIFTVGSGANSNSSVAAEETTSINKNITSSECQLDLPPQLPPPKQNKPLNNNIISSKASGKIKVQKSSKSKIPRSPSLASALSYSNFQPPPISGIPPQTPPLPVGYTNKGKSLNSPTSPASNNNVHFFAGNSNNNNIMAGGNSSNGGAGVGGIGLSSSNSNAQRNSANMAANSRRPQIQISSPIVAESPKNFQYLTLTVRKDENGYGMKVRAVSYDKLFSKFSFIVEMDSFPLNQYWKYCKIRTY